MDEFYKRRKDLNGYGKQCKSCYREIAIEKRQQQNKPKEAVKTLKGDSFYAVAKGLRPEFQKAHHAMDMTVKRASHVSVETFFKSG